MEQKNKRLDEFMGLMFIIFWLLLISYHMLMKFWDEMVIPLYTEKGINDTLLFMFKCFIFILLSILIIFLIIYLGDKLFNYISDKYNKLCKNVYNGSGYFGLGMLHCFCLFQFPSCFVMSIFSVGLAPQHIGIVASILGGFLFLFLYTSIVIYPILAVFLLIFECLNNK